ncbi:MAG: MlaD family protein, partial [Acidimicrobiia bacterium]
TALTPAAAALGQASPALRSALREGVSPLLKVPGVSGLAVPAVEGLTGVARDARPLIPELGEALQLLRGPLELLVPYGPETNLLFDNLRDAFAGGDAQGNWLRTISIVVGADNFSGGSGMANPAVNRNPYPAPGQAATDKDRFQPGGNR